VHLNKSFIDYILPMPMRSGLSKTVWGAAEVGPRDPGNGLEDATMTHWNYWDGQIIKARDGKYHLYASRWDQAKGHHDWWNSKAVHAVSEDLFGPYLDQGLCWPDNQEGKGHNVTALTLPDGRYAIVISETRPGTVFVSGSPDGPWEELGPIEAEGLNTSNVSIINRGLAYDPTTSCIRYSDGTVNHWHKMERPGVLVENGHVVALSLAVMDTSKGEQKGNDGHGSKIIVVPFDGAAFDRDMQDAPDPQPDTEPEKL
jgi:hypothetical protein